MSNFDLRTAPLTERASIMTEPLVIVDDKLDDERHSHMLFPSADYEHAAEEQGLQYD